MRVGLADSQANKFTFDAYHSLSYQDRIQVNCQTGLHHRKSRQANYRCQYDLRCKIVTLTLSQRDWDSRPVPASFHFQAHYCPVADRMPHAE